MKYTPPSRTTVNRSPAPAGQPHEIQLPKVELDRETGMRQDSPKAVPLP